VFYLQVAFFFFLWWIGEFAEEVFFVEGKAFGTDIKYTRPESEARFPEAAQAEGSCR